MKKVYAPEDWKDSRGAKVTTLYHTNTDENPKYYNGSLLSRVRNSSRALLAHTITLVPER